MKQPNTDTEVFAEALTDAASGPAIAPGEIVIGIIAAIDPQGQPLVDYPGNASARPLVAMSTLGITTAHIGRNVALLFAKANPQSPVIMGLIHSPLQDLIVAYDTNRYHSADAERSEPQAEAVKLDNVTVDGKRVLLEASEEVVIKCGEASITLTKAGKILIRGNYLLNRASGVNRILGGSVQVN